MKTCFIFRPWIHYHEGDTTAIPSLARRHLDACPDCQAELAAHREVERRLRESVRKEWLQVPSRLHARTMLALNRKPEREPASGLSLGIRWIGMGVAFSAVALAFWFSINPGGHSTGIAKSPLPKMEPAKVLATQAASVSGKTILEFGEKLQSPLDTEMQNLMNDALNAATVVAKDILPSIAADGQ